MKNLALYGITLLAFAIVQWTVFGERRRETQAFLYPPPEHLEHFTFGFRESMADSLWLRWIQDSDTCQTYLKPIEYLDVSQQKSTVPRYKNCDNSWSFKMLDAVTKLSPRFKMPYLAGAISLSVLTEDYAGASVIFDRGLNAYPEDWSIAYRAAYHELYDVQNNERAAELMLRAARHGGPSWLELLASRILSERGKIEAGISILENYKAGLKEERQIEIIDQRIAGLRAKLKDAR